MGGECKLNPSEVMFVRREWLGLGPEKLETKVVAWTGEVCHRTVCLTKESFEGKDIDFVAGTSVFVTKDDVEKALKHEVSFFGKTTEAQDRDIQRIVQEMMSEEMQ